MPDLETQVENVRKTMERQPAYMGSVEDSIELMESVIEDTQSMIRTLKDENGIE